MQRRVVKPEGNCSSEINKLLSEISRMERKEREERDGICIKKFETT